MTSATPGSPPAVRAAGHGLAIGPGARVAFQGERGAFSEEAVLQLLGTGTQPVPCPTFDAMFAAVADGAADYALAPAENSLAGCVQRVFDLLAGSRLAIVAEAVLAVAHHLIGVPGASLETIATVASHPVALAQCERFFLAHPRLERIAAADTAGSVRDLVRAADSTRAAIAGRRAADLYGAAILQEHLEDHPRNFTRFLLLAPAGAAAPADCDRISLVFELNHRPGALCRALAPFAARGIDITAIHSRPVHGVPWQYRFFVDLAAAMPAAETAAALAELGQVAVRLRVLGIYRHMPPAGIAGGAD